VQLKGKHMGSSDRTTLLAPVVLYAPMGSRKLVLSSVRGVVPGMWVRLWMSDFNGTLVRDLYGGTLRGLMCGPSCSSDLTGQRDLVSWVVRVAAVAGDTVTLQRPLPIKGEPPRGGPQRQIARLVAWSGCPPPGSHRSHRLLRRPPPARSAQPGGAPPGAVVCAPGGRHQGPHRGVPLG
jgi:hypothetical protein